MEEGHGVGDGLQLEHRWCYMNLNVMRVEIGKGSETSMKGFAIKASILEMVS